MAQIHFALDQRLLDQPAGRLFSWLGAEIQLFAIQEGGDPNLLVDLGLGDHLVAGGDGDAVDDFGGKPDQGISGKPEDRRPRVRHQKRLPEREMELEDVNALDGHRHVRARDAAGYNWLMEPSHPKKLRRVGAERKIHANRTERRAIADPETEALDGVVEVLQILLAESQTDLIHRGIDVAHDR